MHSHSLLPRPPRSPLFPYTTLFRSWAVDVNQRALELVKRNMDRAGVTNVIPALPEEVPEDVAFGAIYSNPPVRVGKVSLHDRSEEHTSELQSRFDLVCRLLLEKKKR